MSLLVIGREREVTLKSGVVPELDRGPKKERKRKKYRKEGRNRQTNMKKCAYKKVTVA